jgi:2-isopropylmalate synthase
MAVIAVEHIKDHNAKCMFSAMDATRTEFDYLIQVKLRRRTHAASSEA